jgi:hypothetical protein
VIIVDLKAKYLTRRLCIIEMILNGRLIKNTVTGFVQKLELKDVNNA